MVEKAVTEYNIDKNRSYIIGDMGDSDMLLAMNTGIKGILVRTGAGIESLTSDRTSWAGYEPYYIADNILDAVKIVCK